MWALSHDGVITTYNIHTRKENYIYSIVIQHVYSIALQLVCVYQVHMGGK